MTYRLSKKVRLSSGALLIAIFALSACAKSGAVKEDKELARSLASYRSISVGVTAKDAALTKFAAPVQHQIALQLKEKSTKNKWFDQVTEQTPGAKPAALN